MKVQLNTSVGGQHATHATLTRVNDWPFRIGRSPQCDLCLSADFVSRAHCELLVRGDTVLVRDCDSRNGTYVNGARVYGAPHALQHGDILTIVTTRIEVLIADGTAGQCTAGASRSTQLAAGTIPGRPVLPVADSPQLGPSYASRGSDHHFHSQRATF